MLVSFAIVLAFCGTQTLGVVTRAPPNPFLSLPQCALGCAENNGCTSNDSDSCFCQIQSMVLQCAKQACPGEDYRETVAVFQGPCGSFTETHSGGTLSTATLPGSSTSPSHITTSAECTSLSCGITSSTSGTPSTTVSVTSLSASTSTSRSVSVTVTSVTSGTTTLSSSTGASSASTSTAPAPNAAIGKYIEAATVRTALWSLVLLFLMILLMN